MLRGYAMLRTLTINNIALISFAEIDFAKGLNILTGETGAGKSIIIDSLNFVLGERADKTLIRNGESEALVEAEFDEINTITQKILGEYEIDFEDGLILSRKMTEDGKNVCRINGMKVTVSALKNIAQSLVDIYGQHENSVLLNSDNHIDILDNFIGESIAIAKQEYIAAYKNFKQIKSKLNEYSKLTDVDIRAEILSKQLEEINEANITIGEEIELQKRCDMYDNAEDIIRASNNAYTLLNGDMENNAVDNIYTAIKELSSIEEYSAEISEYISRLDETRIELRDIASSVESISSGISVDEYEAQRDIARLSKIHNIEGKYGDTEEKVLAYRDKIAAEVEELSNYSFMIEKLTDDYNSALDNLEQKGIDLSDVRKNYAKQFEKLVTAELKELGMPNTGFEVDIVTYNDIETIANKASNNGIDIVEFLISPNLGEPLKPLKKVISGGEMSRFMLAIKKITAQIDGVNVMVFDEIDTGISGKIAQVVANKLYDISNSKQVLAVTHLPQLASMADAHYLIEKTTDNMRTNTNVKLLDSTQSALEIAKMIDGISASESAVLHAEKLLEIAKEYKNSQNQA